MQPSCRLGGRTIFSPGERLRRVTTTITPATATVPGVFFCPPLPRYTHVYAGSGASPLPVAAPALARVRRFWCFSFARRCPGTRTCTPVPVLFLCPTLPRHSHVYAGSGASPLPANTVGAAHVRPAGHVPGGCSPWRAPTCARHGAIPAHAHVCRFRRFSFVRHTVGVAHVRPAAGHVPGGCSPWRAPTCARHGAIPAHAHVCRFRWFSFARRCPGTRT